MAPPISKQASHYDLMGGASGSTERQNVDTSQSGPPVAKKGAHTSAGPGGAYITEDNSNPEIIAMERHMEHMFISRGPPNKPTGTPRPKLHSSSTQPQTLRRSDVQTQPPAVYSQAPPVATATGDRHSQPRAQANQKTWGQTHQVSHGQIHQAPHGQMPQVSHGQMHHAQMPQVSHAQMPQVSHGQTYQVPHGQTHQVTHGQTTHHQVSHGQTYQVPHGQTYQVPHGQTPQPAQVQMPRATEGGTSSHGQQRSADKRNMPAVTANQRTTSGSRR